MRKVMSIRVLAMIAAIGSLSTVVPSHPAKAAGTIDLNFENIPTIIGLGFGILPDYSGSDDYTWGIAPFGRYTFSGQERYIQLMGNELTANLINDDMIHIGPLVNYHFGRTDSVDDSFVKEMKEIDDTVEVGAFADIIWANQNDRRQRFLFGVKMYQDVGDESDGFRANVSARYWQPIARPVDLNLTAGLVYHDDDYANTYYGVNPDNVGTSGLAFFEADGGLNEYYGVIGVNIYLSEKWIIGIGIRGSVLAGDADDSPIVDQRGDSTQWIGGIGVGYAMW